MSEQIKANKYNTKLIIIIDHNLGGGAKLYSSTLVQALKETNYLVLHIKYDHRNKNYILLFRGTFYEKEYSLKISSYDDLQEFISSLSPYHVFVNELVTWIDPLAVTGLVLDLNVPYTLFVHDFFCICPSYNLTNEEGVFCNVPDDIKICVRCLSLNKSSPHISLYRDIDFDINTWRQSMSTFLHRARQIVCFSESSKDFLTQVYGNNLHILVNEHSIPEFEMFTWNQKVFNHGSPLTIGIIGSIGLIKGEKILNTLVESQEFKSLPVKIVVVGVTVSHRTGFKTEDGKFIVTSKFDRHDLPGLLDKYGINAVLIPSICPETFSFTVSEAMLLGYPVICFNTGAPAERVKKYKVGIVIDDMSAEGILSGLRQILDNPDLIKEFSANCLKYEPPSAQDHFDKILGILEGADH